MENLVNQIYKNLQKMTGLHRTLLETVRLERENLVQADSKSIQTIIARKQEIVEEVYETESHRLKLIGELAVSWKKPVRDLTLSKLIIEIQGYDQKLAEQFSSTLNALTILIQRITEQNKNNQSLIERSLENIHKMKKNAIGESMSKSNTYTSQGQTSQNAQSRHLISKEA